MFFLIAFNVKASIFADKDAYGLCGETTFTGL